MDVRVDQAGQVKILIFNIAGQEVKPVCNQYMPIGQYRMYWDGCNGQGAKVGNAVYFIVLQQPSGQIIRKVILLK
jgi:hypothetical protein